MTAVRQLLAAGREMDERRAQLDAMEARTRAARCACGAVVLVAKGRLAVHNEPQGDGCIFGGEAWRDVARVAVSEAPQ